MTNSQSGGCSRMNRDRNRIFSARNMKSEEKRRERYWDGCVPMMKVGGSRGWSVYNGSALLSLLALTSLCGMSIANPTTCTFGTNTMSICNRGNSVEKNLVIEYESSDRALRCVRKWSETYPRVRGDDASELVLLVNNETVKPDLVYDRNKDLIRLSLDKLAPSNYTYECRLKHINSEQYKILLYGTITVGFTPKRPRGFKCMSYNWERLICTWEPVPNFVPTRFSLRLVPDDEIADESSGACPKSQNESEISANSCLWDASTNPPYRRMDENYTFALDAENDLGTDSFEYSFHHWAHVVPSPPVNLSVLDTTYSNVQLYWSVPVALHDFPPGLHHRVSYQMLSDDQETWHTIDVTNEAHATEIYFKLPDLEGPDTLYRVRVSTKSSLADEDLWSQSSNTFFSTTSPPPSRPPITDVGSFEVVGNNYDNRDVYIYWQWILGPYEIEDNLSYKVVRVDEDGHRLDLQPHEITKTYAKFTGIGSNSVSFRIAAANYDGADHSTATVHVPSQLKIPRKPVVFTKIAVDEGIYELSWDSTKNPRITNYTIFWCENARDRPYQCSGYIDWIHVPGTTNIYNVTVPDPKKVYQFAIAANTPQASSGMVWFSSTTSLVNDVGKPKSVQIIHTGSELIEVGWELEYSGRLGTVEAVNVYYCPILPLQYKCADPKMNKTVTTNPQQTYGVVSSLKPNTTYMLTVAVTSRDAEGPHSEPLYFTTLEAGLKSSSMGTARADAYSCPSSPSLAENVKTAIERSFSDGKDFIEKLMKQREEAFDRTMDRIEGKLNSSIITSVNQVSNLTPPTVSALEAKLDSVLKEIGQLRTNLTQCCCQESTIGQGIDIH